MLLTETEKKRLGKLFDYYRISRGINIKQIEGEGLSAYSTFHYATKGKVIKNDEFYLNYLDYFGLSFKCKDNFEEWLSDYLIRLVHVFEYYEEDRFDELYHEMIQELTPYKDSAIYHEYICVFEYLFGYYRENKYMRLEEVNDCLVMIKTDIIEDELKILLLDLMFRSNNDFIGSYKLADKIILYIQKFENHPMMKYQLAFYNKYECHFLKALELFKESLNIFEEQQNKYWQIKCRLSIYGIYRNTDDSLAQKEAKKLLEMKRTQDIPNVLKKNMNYSLGMDNYLNKRYDTAYQLFMENIKNHQSLNELLFVCSICSHKQMDYPKELCEENIKTRYDVDYLRYFLMVKEGASDDELVEYIMKRIIPDQLKYQKYYHPFWSLMEYEMEKIALRNTKHKKSYLNFHQKMNEFIRNA
ncbi:hypothetical protein [Traorella massiliensis]|uniref:hypothetical protein n=1 Tax=Traorella massiliensis TaxID=1903263 RepID=UPI0008F83F8B|nr:hypothetical protein [Traorella massiliensis]